MILQHEREEVVAYGKKLVSGSLTKGTGGNISIFNRSQQLVAISPSGLDYDATLPEDIVVLDLQGRSVDGKRKPSSEMAMHLALYYSRADISAVVHTHSLFATVLACLQTGLPAVHYLIGFAGKDVRCAPYATFGSHELADGACAAMRDRKAVLLANHGVLTGGATISEAYSVAEMVEYCAEIFYRTKNIGEPVMMPDDEMERIIEKFKTYGK
ncbi:MAG: L-fuculose-phosphate aldolase [bacterium]|nr:L-fuculose-phosphate aldolase [bacterium]